MASPSGLIDQMPVIGDRSQFDTRSGNWLERLVFNHRLVLVVISALITVFLSFQAAKLHVNASFDKLIPQSHPYIKNYFEHRDDLKGIDNTVRIAVESTRGDVWNKDYLEVLRQVNDALYLMPGMNHPYQKSLWMSSVRWTEVTEEGFRGGPVMPPDYDGSAASIDRLRSNTLRSGSVGTLVSNDFKSSMVNVPVLGVYPETGERIDYGQLNKQLEGIRSIEKKALDEQGNPLVRIHIVGFAKVAGDLIDGLMQVMAYFAIAAAVAVAIIYLYTRCARSTAVVVVCSLVAVAWQLGTVRLIGQELDPYSILVPFLVFAIGVSHGAQKMNGIMLDIGRGSDRYVAARYTFRRLFVAGVTALIADAVGFGVLMLIDIPIIRDLALSAAIGMAILAFTNLLLLPILLSYTGVSQKAAARSLRDETAQATGGTPAKTAWTLLARLTEPRAAAVVVVISALLGVAGFAVSTRLQIGDLDAGVPELRPDSRYNRDNAFVSNSFSLSADQFVVIAKTAPGGCEKASTLMQVDNLGLTLRQVPGVQTTVSLADEAALAMAGMFEGSAKWISISHDQGMTNTAVLRAQDRNRDLFNNECSVVPVIAYLADHKADTLQRVLSATESFAAVNDSKEVRFLPAAGSSGIEAVTNIVVHDANRAMLMYVYAAVVVLCFVSFGTWRAVVVAIVPLALTSVLVEALMVMLGMGVKVATLPVVALGVGIGVDYALYLLSVQLSFMRAGASLREAYAHALRFTGKVVALVAVTLAAGVVTWAWSPIKFQADMGILLTFMFLWNMLGALVLIPALSYFLLPPSSVVRVTAVGRTVGVQAR